VGRLTDIIKAGDWRDGAAWGKLRENTDVIPLCVEAKRLEEIGDAIYHECWASCSMRRKDPIELIKWKEVYDTLETTIDEAETSRMISSLSR